MNTEYKFELSQFGFKCDLFKQKPAFILQNTISNSRLGYDIKFNSFANIYFDESDLKYRYPIIELLDSFNRNKTNCLVYDVKDESKIYRFYNKVFVFQYVGKSESFYSVILYHTETKRFSHKFLIYYDVTEICKYITTVFNNLEFCENVYNELEIKKNIIKRA